MSRRECDKHTDCKDCDYYSRYTENLKKIMQEEDYEKASNFLQIYHDKLTDLYEGFPKFKREWICMMHYYNPDGIYDD